MADETSKATWTQSFQYQSSMASAEWITEPPYAGGILPLADYDQATYDPVEANGANPNLSLSANGIIAVDPWGETSNPSAPAQGDAFTTCWGANGAGLAPCVAGSITAPAAPSQTSSSSSSSPPPPPLAVNNVAVNFGANPTTTVDPGGGVKIDLGGEERYLVYRGRVYRRAGWLGLGVSEGDVFLFGDLHGRRRCRDGDGDRDRQIAQRQAG